MDWNPLSGIQLLNETFIEEIKDKINWKSGKVVCKWTSHHQSLSEDFIGEFKDKGNGFLSTNAFPNFLFESSKIE